MITIYNAVMDAGESITESLIAANRAAAERERLEREVVEKAKARRKAQDAMFRQGTVEGCLDFEASDSQYEAALSALIDFEFNQREK